MLKKRIIFALLYSDGYFFLSRNFRLQKVGDVNWLINNFGFGKTCHFIDELICLLIKENPTKDDKNKFFSDINNLRKKFFVPITLGGGIRTLNDAKIFFLNGADKIMLNSAVYDTTLIQSISDLYGEQSISVKVDYRMSDNGNERNIFINGGSKFKVTLSDFIINYLDLFLYGEIIFNSIDQSGSGAGFDMEILKKLPDRIVKPFLLMGGAGMPEHICDALKIAKVSGLVTSNLFNFLGTGLEVCRKKSLENGINLAKFSSVELV